MDQMGCEAVANVLHLVNCASIKLVGQQLQQKLVPIVAVLVDTTLNVALEAPRETSSIGLWQREACAGQFIRLCGLRESAIHSHQQR